VAAVGVALGAHALHDDIRARLSVTLRLQRVRGVRNRCEQVDERRHRDVAADPAAVGPVHNDLDHNRHLRAHKSIQTCNEIKKNTRNKRKYLVIQAAGNAVNLALFVFKRHDTVCIRGPWR
jgi:hypothetical protein